MTTMTERAEAVLAAIRDYEHLCDVRRREISQREYGHGGAFIPSEAPNDAGRVQAIEQALRAIDLQTPA